MKRYIKSNSVLKKRRAIKASEFSSGFESMFYSSLNQLNGYFSQVTEFDCRVGDVYGATFSRFSKRDCEYFIRCVWHLNMNNQDQNIHDYISRYIQEPVFQYAIEGRQEEYIQEFISGEDINNMDDTIAYPDEMEDSWWDEYENDLYKVSIQIAKSICEYLTLFAEQVEYVETDEDYSRMAWDDNEYSIWAIKGGI